MPIVKATLKFTPQWKKLIYRVQIGIIKIEAVFWRHKRSAVTSNRSLFFPLNSWGGVGLNPSPLKAEEEERQKDG